MEVIRLREALRRVDAADFRSSPRNLHNAELVPDRMSVRAVQTAGSNIAGTIGVTGKPYFTTADDIVSAANNVEAGDFFNQHLYTSSTSGIKVFPPDWDGGNESTSVPYVSSVSGSVVAGQTGGWQPGTDGWTGYVIIPYNSRGESGAWQYWSYKYSALIKYTGDGLAMKKPTTQINVQVSSDTAYFEVYRTCELMQSLGAADWSGRFYYMGRYQASVAGQADSSTVAVTDGFSWYESGYATYQTKELNLDTVTSIDDLISSGVFTAEEATIPEYTLDLPITMHSAKYNGASFNCSAANDAINCVAPSIFRAKTMMNHKGVMLYGDVTWEPFQPAVLGWVAGTPGVTIKAQTEYETVAGKRYGPVLTLTGVGRVLFAWQGEAAILIYNGNDDLLYRLVPDSRGRYSKADQSAVQEVTVTGEQRNDEFTGEPVADEVDFVEVVSQLWSFDESWSITGAVGSDTQASSSVNEPNVVMMASKDRPLEVTVDQFYLPDNSPVRKIMAARLDEDESLVAYDGYAFTDYSLFYFSRQGRDVSVDYVTHTVGLKWSTYSKGAATLVRDGVAFIGSDDRLYLLSGRRIQALDTDFRDLWSSAYDISYHRKNNQLYILTDTGIWCYDFERYRGIFKQIHVALNGGSIDNDQAALQYIEDTIDGVPYEGVLLYDSRTSSAYLLESSGSYASDAYVETQWIRPDTMERTGVELQVDHDSGLRSREYSMSLGSNTLTLDGSPSLFSSSNVGQFINLSQAGVSGGRLITRITQVNSPSSVNVADACANAAGVSGATAIWPVCEVTHSVRGPEEESISFLAYPFKRRFPRPRGYEHQLKIEKFKELREVRVNIREW